jgi:uncharacterized protein (TIRG00374 family)
MHSTVNTPSPAAQALSKARERPLWKRLLPLIGVALLAWLISRLDGAQFRDAFARVPASVFALASLSFTVNLVLKAVRWKRLLIVQRIELPTSVAVAAFFAGQFWGQVTLGRMGEFMRAEVLIERKVPASQALSSCVYDRILDLALVLLLGAVLGAFAVGELRAAVAAAVLALLGGVVLAVLVRPELLPATARTRVSALVAWLSRIGPLGKALGFARELFAGMRPMLRPAPLLEASAWTLVSWLGYFAALWQLADAMGITASRLSLTAGASLAALSALLPVTFSGLGARELIFQQLLGLEGTASALAVALGLLHLAVMSGSALGFGFLAMLWLQRRRHAIEA